MLPRVIGGLVALVTTAIVIALVPPPPGSGVDALNQYNADVGTHPLNLVTPVVRMGTFLWSGYLWVHAVSRARSVSRKEAAVTVGIPLAIELLVTLLLLALAAVGVAAMA